MATTHQQPNSVIWHMSPFLVQDGHHLPCALLHYGMFIHSFVQNMNFPPQLADLIWAPAFGAAEIRDNMGWAAELGN